ncbi:MAG: leucyl aminopeptidase [bacterium]|nr:leucyl aminopeptidase [bacterium]
MKLILSKKIPYNRLKADALVVPLFKGEKESVYALPVSVKKIVAAVIASKEFQGGAMETQLVHTGGNGVSRVCLLGLGEKKECSLDIVQRAYGTAIMRLKKAKAKSVVLLVREDAVSGEAGPGSAGKDKAVADIVGAIATGVRIANYHTHEYKSKKKELHSIAKCILLVPSTIDRTIKSALTRAETIVDGLDFVRSISNSPANYATPQYVAESAKELAKKTPGLTVTVFDKKQIEKEKMGGLLAVAQGSQHEPRFVICEYKGHPCNDDKGAPCRPIVLVGKGITFDTGGISLKPWKGMEEMKFDMAGGAAVMATVAIAAKLKLPMHVVGLVPLAENMPSHTAYKPGDVITISDGTTVEILSTDAEGRMVLADGLCYAKKYKPSVVVDVATLTGAIVAALSDYASGLFTDDDAIALTLERLGKETGDRVWRMPMPKEWADHLKSPVADLRQVPSARLADATMAALFLKNFSDAKTPWVHIDNAGTAWKTEGYSYAEAGATGAPVQLLVAWLEDLGKKEVK